MTKRKAPATYQPSGKSATERGAYEPDAPIPRPDTAPIKLAGGDFASQCENKIDGMQCAQKKEPGSRFCKSCGKKRSRSR